MSELTPESIRARVAEYMSGESHGFDPEEAHVDLDDILQDTLVLIASGRVRGMAALASDALECTELSIDRWYA